MSKPTPGPWRTELNPSNPKQWIVVASTHETVVHHVAGGKDHAEANARLIAASWETLEALKDCVQWLTAFAKGTGNDIIRETDRYQKYVDAIARAEGGQS